MPLIGDRKGRRNIKPQRKPPSIEGFGNIDGEFSLWPAGLPQDFYWTGTERNGPRPVEAWLVAPREGYVFVQSSPQSESYRVVCVPLADK